MDEANWRTRWKEVLSTLDFRGPATSKTRPTPGDSHLLRLEQELKIRLPLSYRAFIQVFGPGIVAQSFTVYAPGFRGAFAIDFLAHNKWQDLEADRRENPEQIRRLVAFADFGYDNFVWDPEGATNSPDNEHEILFVPKSPTEPLTKITHTFESFILDYCLGGKYLTIVDPSFKPVPEDLLSFEPIGRGPTSPV